MNILILGNGFDLDMGLPTRYIDFIQSAESEIINTYKDYPDCLASHLYKHSDSQWFDIEEAMAKYVEIKENTKDYSNVEIDKLIFKELKRNFSDYVDNRMMQIGSVSWNEPVKNSLAKEIIETQNKREFFDNIYSFNCFDCQYYHFATNDEIESLPGVVNIHGSGDNFILGIGDNDCKIDEYSFLKKTHQIGYPVEDVKVFKSALINADNIVFFGHSLNRIDMMMYFYELFNQCVQTNRHSKSIIFITKDDNSALSIKENISKYAVPFVELELFAKTSFILTSKSNIQDNLKRLKSILYSQNHN